MNLRIHNVSHPIIFSKILEVFCRYLIYPLQIVYSSCDLVHITDHTYAYLSIFAKRTNKRVVITVHNRLNDITSDDMLSAQSETVLLPWLSKRLFLFSLKHLGLADALVCVSKSVSKSLKIRLGHIRKEVIYMPISDIFFSPSAKSGGGIVDNKLRPWGDSFCVLHVGNNDRAHKNVEYIYSCIKLLKDRGHAVCFLKVGDRFTVRQNQLIKKLDIQDRVIHLGSLNQKDLKRVYRRADVLLFPSFYEGCPAPPLEALACDLPVIVSDISPHKEILQDCAYFINPHKPIEAAIIIEKMIRKEIDSRDKLVVGKQIAGGYRWKNAIDQTIQLYEQILEAPRAESPWIL